MENIQMGKEQSKEENKKQNRRKEHKRNERNRKFEIEQPERILEEVASNERRGKQEENMEICNSPPFL